MHAVISILLAAIFLHFIIVMSIDAVWKWRSRLKLSRQRGCKSLRLEQPWDYLGIRKIVEAARAVLFGSMLDYMDVLWPRYGDTYCSNFIGQKVIFTRDASNMKQILVSQWSDYTAARHLRIRMFMYLAPGAIAASDGLAWKNLRSMWRHQFSSLNNFFNITSQEEHFQKMKSLIPAGTLVDMQPLFTSLMSDLMMDVMLGNAIGCLDPEQTSEAKYFVESLDYVSDKMAKDGFLGPASVLLPKKKQLEATAYIHSYLDKGIRTRLEEKRCTGDWSTSPDEPCVLDNLMNQTTDVLELRGLVLSLLLGANQSVGSLLSSTIWALTRNPEVFEKLRTSILDNVGYTPPTNQQLKSFTYLSDVIHEVLRLYPPLPFNARIASKDTWLGSGGGPDGKDPLLVKRGQCIVFSIWGSQRSEKNFGDDAHLFRPERWRSLKVDTLGFLPFLMGPRQCLGQQFALLEVTYVVVRLLQTFERIEGGNNDPFKPMVRLSLTHRDGVFVTFTPDVRNC